MPQTVLLPPAEIVRQAASIGLEAIALTDHDTISGIDEFIQAATAADITAIPGVEISSLFSGREIHILGYFVDHRHPDLLAFLSITSGSGAIPVMRILSGACNRWGMRLRWRKSWLVPGEKASAVPIWRRC